VPGSASLSCRTGSPPGMTPTASELICDRLGSRDIQAFFGRRMSRLPLPLTPADRAGGYWRELSMRQAGVSRTIVFAAPRHARAFLEALVADNLDLGRPEHVELLFKRSPCGRKPRERPTGPSRPRSDAAATASPSMHSGAAQRLGQVKQAAADPCVDPARADPVARPGTLIVNVRERAHSRIGDHADRGE
jgi:hypothetical protein